MEEKQWKKIKPVVMVVLDGFGVASYRKGNAVINANTPNIDQFWSEYPHMLLNASGESVGLPWGEYGNSEVGHITLGLGQVIKQSLALIKESIISGDFYDNSNLIWAINKAKNSGRRLHIAGIFSPAGVHGHLEYMFALLRMCQKIGMKDVYLHLYTDGRDVPPQSFNDFFNQLNKVITETGCGKVASVAGRYYGMDRISQWDRTDLTYKAMLGIGSETASGVEELIENSYQKGIFDEMIVPTAIVDGNGRPIGQVQNGDSIIFTNHRRDRIRQIASYFVSDEQVIKDSRLSAKLDNLSVVSMVFYELVNMGVRVAFTPEEINRSSGELLSLAKVVSENSFKQFHIAETEKFPHVTYFFNGGEQAIFDGEEHKLIPSPKVRGYEEKPEMSLSQVIDEMKQVIVSGNYSFVLANFANPDMVGHSGVYEAGIKAVEVVDQCLGKLAEDVLKMDGSMIITSDHGNCEEMINPISGNISKEHSSNPVPFMLIDNRFKFDRGRKETFAEAGNLIANGLLADVAPTVMQLMGINIPDEITGVSLIDSLQ